MPELGGQIEPDVLEAAGRRSLHFRGRPKSDGRRTREAGSVAEHSLGGSSVKFSGSAPTEWQQPDRRSVG